MKENQVTRNCGLDLVRCFALFSVIGIHFFLEIHFDEIMISGWYTYILLLVRTIFLVCVPLFMVLSGYLMGTRKPERKYYRKLIKTLSIYLMASLCCGAFYVLYYLIFEHRLVPIVDELLGILDYTTAPYGWYIEMYIGLFLLIPYLNILYNNIGSREGKRNLILTLLCLTVLPSAVNIFYLRDLRWWIQPSTFQDYTKLVPSWWERIYPLTYYFLGCYLREYPLKITRKQNLLLILLVHFLAGTFAYYRNYGSIFIDGAWQAYTSPFVVALTVLVFEYFVCADYSRVSPKTAGFLAYLSNLCLAAYLVSWIFDTVVYFILFRIFPGLNYQLLLLPIGVPVIFVCSLALSAVINWVYSLISRKRTA